MTDREIHDAYERMGPDAAARERMLARLLASGPEKRRRGIRTQRALLVAAVLTAGLALAAFGWVSNILREVNFGKQELTIPKVHEDGSLEHSNVEVDVISMQGFVGSPEYEACAEWLDFLDGYDPDGSLLAAVGNGPTGIPTDYDAYSCYTWEMAEELDRICEKYGLALLGATLDAVEPEHLFARTGTVGICDGAGAPNKPDWGYCYSDDTLFFEGVVTLPGPVRTIDYQFSRAVKGSLNTVALNIGAVEEYEQWMYTTQNGVPLLLANNGDSKAVIIADRESSFVVINVLGDWPEGTFDMTAEDLELFAEAFDFTAVS